MSAEPLVQCVPNFSEGRDSLTIDAIVGAGRVDGVRVADWSADADHNRMVVTLVGPPDRVVAASIAMAEVAVAAIDLNKHEGAHPRLGALDVLPFVPLRDIDLADCAALALQAAEEIARRLQLPIFLYEAASSQGRSLPFVRKEAFVTLAPDFGPAQPHSTAGAAVVGARGPLIAFNVDLGTHDIRLARSIARELRARYPGRVRALGLALASRGIVQVSMNIVEPQSVSLLEVLAYIGERAPVLRGELIGAVPGYTAFDALRSALRASELRPGQVLLENWPG